MSNPYVGEIRLFAGNFAPVGWALCNGQLLPIAENDVLFALIGTTYGGDGQETFAMPDLRGRVPIHMGQGYVIGEQAGGEQVTLTIQQIPNHNHSFLASGDVALSPDPSGNLVAEPPSLNLFFGDVATTALHPLSIQPVGGTQPHDNMQPYICLNFIISLFGIFPTPS